MNKQVTKKQWKKETEEAKIEEEEKINGWKRKLKKNLEQIDISKENRENLYRMIDKHSYEDFIKWIPDANFYIKNRRFHDGLIGYYENWQYLLTSAPTQYGTHTIIQLIGHAIGYNSVHAFTPDRIPHNIYLCLVGESGIARKSTAQDRGKDVYPKILMLSTSFSPEGLLKELQEKPKGIAFLGEFSTVLRALNTRSYLSGYKEISNDLFRWKGDFIRKLTKGSVTVSNPYFAQSTTVTPIQLINNLSLELISGGFLPRFMLVHGDDQYRDRDEIPIEAFDMKSEIEKVLWTLHELTQYGHFKFTFSKKAKKLVNKFDRMFNTDKNYKEVLPFVARYMEYIIVYADIIRLSKRIMEIGTGVFTNITDITAITPITTITHNKKLPVTNVIDEIDAIKVIKSDSNFKETIPTCKIIVKETDVQEAWDIIAPCLDYAKEVCQYVTERKIVARVIQTLKKYGKMKHNKCLKYSRLKISEFNEAIRTLEERNDIRTTTYTDANGIVKSDTYEYVGD